jgi:D-3-phosphoglycerate dehydrogenase / 2-oxoglutarate reductase
MKTLFIYCNDQLAPVWRQVVRADDPPIDVNRTAFATDELPCLLDGYAICIDDHSYLPTPLAARCADLKHVVFLGTGAASYMNVGELAERGIRVHTIKGYGDTAVAEHTIALMMAACRDVARMDREIRSGHWVTREGLQLAGKTLGIIGLGGIGREVARIGRGLGMQVIAWNRTPRPGEALVKPGAVLINTARGALVDETALIEALRHGRIRHAGLDVFENEPLRPGHPFAAMDNVTLTAHAGFRTLEASMTLLRRGIDIVKSIQQRAQPAVG